MWLFKHKNTIIINKKNLSIKTVFFDLYLPGLQTRYINVWTMMNRIHEKIANTYHDDFRR